MKIYDNCKVWTKNGLRHREDGPAIIDSDGTEYWCVNDNFHREDGPAIIDVNGNEEWYLNGKLHREDGPAIIKYDGYQAWSFNGLPSTYLVTRWMNDKGYSWTRETPWNDEIKAEFLLTFGNIKYYE